MKKILFTGGGGAATEGIWHLWHQKYDLYFADADKTVISSIIPADKCIEIPFASNKNFITELINICDKYQIDLLIPGVDEELQQCHQIVEKAKNTQILLPNLDFVILMMDKYQFSQALWESDLQAPESFLASNLDNVPESFFPAIMKPIQGRGSRGVSLIKTKEQAEAYCVLSDKKPPEIIIQEYAKGDEYTVFMASDNQGNLSAIIPIKVDVKRGITVKAHIDANKYVVDYCKKFHNYFKPNCLYNIQLIIDSHNQIYPFEVNPRISTTFILGISTGFDPIEMFFEGAKSSIFIPHTTLSLKRSWVNHIS